MCFLQFCFASERHRPPPPIVVYFVHFTRTIFEFEFNLLAKWKFAHIIGILLNISAASNAPILYFNSQEYRKSFDKELQNITKICTRNAVQPQ
uniref:G_PROTEIN_RECEP_F1_2 domain-containing protein n=1 Tax=Globodera pallida TaxID=36090 RepID=A0A183BJ31_GLOPA